MKGMKEIIQEYLEETIKNDAALAEVYDASKMDDCIKFITGRAQKQPRSGNCVCIEDAVVFKWARDFFYGDPEDDQTKVVVQPVIVKDGYKDTSHKPEDDVPLDSEVTEQKEEANVLHPDFNAGDDKHDEKPAETKKKKQAEDPKQLLMFDLWGE